MPVHSCTQDGKSGYQWGSGACYTYPEGDESARKEAKRKAYVQGYAAEQNGAKAADDAVIEKMGGGPFLIEKAFMVESVPPVEEDIALAKINTLAPELVEPEDVYIGRARLANDQVDRAFERFPVSYLQRFAETLPGLPVLEGHDRRRSAVGRWFGAAVERQSDGSHQLVADYYLPANSDLANRVRMGIAKEVSISATAAGRSCDVCKAGFGGCDHIPGETYDGRLATVSYGGDTRRVSALEGSFVGVACQYGAQAVPAKSWVPGGSLVIGWEPRTVFSRSNEVVIKSAGDSPMDIEKVKEFEERIQALETEKAAILVENAALKEQSGLITAGKAYFDDLRAEISRKLGLLEEDEGPTLRLLENANLETIKAWDEQLGARLRLKFPATPVSRRLGEGADKAPLPDAKTPLPFDPLASLRGG